MTNEEFLSLGLEKLNQPEKYMQERTLSRLPPLNSLRAFEAAARLLSFKEAAEELHVTPAAISQQIRQLEDFLGSPLFSRSKSGVKLSAEGEILYPKLRKGFEHILEAVLAFDQDQKRNIIRVTAGPAFVAKWLVPHLHNFSSSHQDLEIDIIANLSTLDLKKSHLDLAIRFGNPPTGDVFSEMMIEEKVVPMVAPSLLNNQTLSSPEDLTKFELIHDKSLSLIKDDTPNWEKWFKETKTQENSPNRGTYFNQADHAIQAAVNGAGVVLGRLILGLPDILAGRLVIPFGPALPSGLHFYFVQNETSKNEASVEEFKQWIAKKVNEDLASLKAV